MWESRKGPFLQCCSERSTSGPQTFDFASINSCNDRIGFLIDLRGHCDMRRGYARVFIKT